MNYSCDRRSDGQYSVREIPTGQIIKGNAGYAAEARRYTAFLNNGGAFNGFTPPFILQKAEIPIDQEFSATFSH